MIGVTVTKHNPTAVSSRSSLINQWEYKQASVGSSEHELVNVAFKTI